MVAIGGRTSRDLYVRSPGQSHHLPRFKAIVAYDGTDFEGWQTQLSGRTVQDVIEARLSKMLGVPIQIAGSGRTDSGVHARGQCFHFELPEAASCRGVLPPMPKDLEWTEEWHIKAAASLDRALSGLSENNGLPPSIQVLEVRPAAPTFHAKESRIGARYCYSVIEGSGCPMSARYCWAIGKRTLDVALMAEAAALMQGAHDFSSLAFRSPDDPRTPIKQMRTLEVKREAGPSGVVVTISAECDRFLQHMMRIIAGTLVHVGIGRLTVADVTTLLVAGSRKDGSVSKAYKAPAHGLCLERCFYELPGAEWMPEEHAAPARSLQVPPLAAECIVQDAQCLLTSAQVTQISWAYKQWAKYYAVVCGSRAAGWRPW